MKIIVKDSQLILAKHLHVDFNCDFDTYGLWFKHGLFDSYFQKPEITEVWFDDTVGMARRYWEIHQYVREHFLLTGDGWNLCDCFGPSFIP
jgi:hypothetical protein